jgi:peptidoglycan/xylan/chitin deacetylase (PgdA/CDA1 family)
MRRANKAALLCLGFSCAVAVGGPAPSCPKPLYLTFDTGHMDVAPWIAQVLQRQKVQVTFFVAQEKTMQGDGSLGDAWSAWWSARAAEGHDFASHTFDHVYWQADESPATLDAPARFKVRPSSGARAGQSMSWSSDAYCDNLKQATTRIEVLTGRPSLPLFRAPGGKTSAQLLTAAKACGYAHVGWAPAGFLGDELPSERYTNAHLLDQAVNDIRPGHILMAHLGIWSRKDPWAPAVLEPLIVALKAKGYCFATLREHPKYRNWISQHNRSASWKP